MLLLTLAIRNLTRRRARTILTVLGVAIAISFTVGMSWSAFAEDGLVAVGGLGRTDDGGLAVWLLFTDRITPGRFVAIYRELARRLEQVLDAGESLTVHIDPDFPEAARLAERLGFRRDGEFRFDDGKNMIRMVAR